jgi:hypothetical protein
VFERGRVLRSMILALNEHLKFAVLHNIETITNMPKLIMQLVSSRPSVYAEVLDTFSDLRTLIINIIHSEWVHCANKSQSEALERNDDECVQMISLTLYTTSVTSGKVELPQPLLQTVCVLLSIWKDDAVGKSSTQDSEYVMHLVDSLLMPDAENTEVARDTCCGLGSATMQGSDAVTVESVS